MNMPIANERKQPVKIFGIKGRISRMRYAAYIFSAWAILGIAFFVINNIIDFLIISGISGRDNCISELSPLTLDRIICALALGVPYLIFHVLVTIPRSHDMNLSGWTALLTLIPLVAVVWMLKSGTEGANRFGAPPPPNSTGLKIVFGVSIPLAVIGVVIIAFMLGLALVGALSEMYHEMHDPMYHSFRLECTFS